MTPQHAPEPVTLTKKRHDEDDREHRAGRGGGDPARGPRGGERRARPEHALAGIEPLREWALCAAERRARLDSAHQSPESVGSLDVVQGERQRAPQRSRWHRAHEHEIADQRIAMAPAHVQVANSSTLYRTLDTPAAPKA